MDDQAEETPAVGSRKIKVVAGLALLVTILALGGVDADGPYVALAGLGLSFCAGNAQEHKWSGGYGDER